MKPATDIAEYTHTIGSSPLAGSGLATEPADVPEAELDLELAPPAGQTAVDAVRPSRLRDLYELTKPRMNFLVLCTTAVGFYMAPRAPAGIWTLFHLLLGTALTAASSAVINQLVERDFDALMPRTRNRPIPAGRIGTTAALWMGLAYGLLGVAWLAFFVNGLTAALGAFTLLSYVGIYTPLKRVTSLNTVVGAIPGAIPPAMGWTGATGTLSPEALALFGILFLWQMPHFLAIAILYKRDYAAGGFKMLPVVDSPDLGLTARMILLYGLALIPAALVPAALHMAGPAYLTAAILLSLGFYTFCIICAITRTRLDARKLFFSSIIYLPLLLGMLMIDKR